MRGTLAAGRAWARSSTTISATSTASIYALEADGFSYAELKTFADDVRQQLLRVHDVAKVELFGVQDEKLYIEISQKRLAQLGLDFNQVLAQLGQQNAIESAGTMQTPPTCVQVRVAGQFKSVDAAARHADPRQLRQPAASWATSPRSSAATSTRRRSRCATRARK